MTTHSLESSSEPVSGHRHDGELLVAFDRDGQGVVVDEAVHPCAAHILCEVLGDIDGSPVAPHPPPAATSPDPLSSMPGGDTFLSLVRGASTEPPERFAVERSRSPLQTEILELFCQGYSNQRIAELLFVTIDSVKTYGVGRYSETEASGEVLTHDLKRRPQPAS